MKEQLTTIVDHAINALKTQGIVPQDIPVKIKIEHSRDKQYGDFACNIAMTLAKTAKCPPRELAEKIINNLPQSPIIEKVEIAGPGFINFYLQADAIQQVVKTILATKEKYGHCDIGKQQRVYIEYVSANPTGPLHVGHGRGAAYGDTCANILDIAGFNVYREYYVNDAGRQMNILATSVWLRYLELHNISFNFPSNGYKGDYVIDIAKQLARKYGDTFLQDKDAIFSNVSEDAKDDGSGDKEAHIDDLISRCQELIGKNNYNLIFDLGLNTILDDIKDDLSEFGLTYDNWFSERQLFTSGAIEESINTLKAAGHTYERDGNLWFNATAFGDEKDRVLIRANGAPTYFASDVAYHYQKCQRADKVIDVLGADHHGYVPRIKAVLSALDIDSSQFAAYLVQFAILYRGKERVQMSTRSGSFITLRELRNEVGNDAARFFYVMRKHEQHMDFDLELAKSHSNENPVYYIQYAHARICSVFRQLHDKNLTWDQENSFAHLDQLSLEDEVDLLHQLARYPEVIKQAAVLCEPHQIAHYLRQLATSFHSYYNAHQFIVDDVNIRNIRLTLIAAIQQVIKNGLTLLGVKAPETM
jgi:arginyl-tRNA synthetase